MVILSKSHLMASINSPCTITPSSLCSNCNWFVVIEEFYRAQKVIPLHQVWPVHFFVLPDRNLLVDG